MHQLMFFTQRNILFFCLFFGIGKCSAAAHIEENSSKHNESRMDITGKQKKYYVYCIFKKMYRFILSEKYLLIANRKNYL